MTAATLALVSVAVLALAALLSLVLFIARLGMGLRSDPERPPWPMPGGPARPLWREQWDPRVPFPSDPIAEQWDQEEAREVAGRLRREAALASERETGWLAHR